MGWIIVIGWYLLGMLGSGVGTAMFNKLHNIHRREKSRLWWIVSLSGPFVLLGILISYYTVINGDERPDSIYHWHKWW